MLNVLWAAIQTTEDALPSWHPTTTAGVAAWTRGPSSTACAQHLRTGGSSTKSWRGIATCDLPLRKYILIQTPNPRRMRWVDLTRPGSANTGAKPELCDTGRPPTARPGPEVTVFLPAVISIVSTEVSYPRQEPCHRFTQETSAIYLHVRLHHRRAGPSSVITEGCQGPTLPIKC